MLNDEAIEEEDLVVYFNLGGHHVPTSQDVPNTLMHTSASSVMFVPFNYFDEDVSRAVRQGVRVDRRPQQKVVTVGDAEGGMGAKGEVRRASRHGKRDADRGREKDNDGVSYFGGHYTSPVTIPVQQLSPDLSRYMKERDDGKEGEGGPGEWKAVRNNVGGGLFGLYDEKERIEEEGGRMES